MWIDGVVTMVYRNKDGSGRLVLGPRVGLNGEESNPGHHVLAFDESTSDVFGLQGLAVTGDPAGGGHLRLDDDVIGERVGFNGVRLTDGSRLRTRIRNYHHRRAE